MAHFYKERFRHSNLVYPLYSLNNSPHSCVRKHAYCLIKHGFGASVKKRKLFCNSWKCSYCGPRMAVMLREKILRVCESHELNLFATFTLPGNSKPFHPSSFKLMSNIWDTFREKMRKYLRGNFVYISVLAIGESGNVHKHVLLSKSIDKQLLAEMWKQSGGGFIGTQEVYQTLGIANYMPKNLLESSFPRNIRKFSHSKGLNLSLRRIRGPWKTVLGMTSLMQLPDTFKILYSEKDSEGTLVYCIVREPYNRHVRSD